MLIARKLISRVHEKEDSLAAHSRRYQSLLDAYIRQPNFKRMLSRVSAAQDEMNFRSIAVLSEYAGEGKTLFISALALGYALYLRRRVLIMDTVHQTADESFYFQSLMRFEEESTAGRRRGNSYQDAPQGGLDLLTTRTIDLQIHGSIGERRGARRYEVSDFFIGDFLRKQCERYDIVLVDTCALSRVNASHMDPVVLATQTDRVILLLSPKSLESRVIAGLRKTLADKRINVLGAMVNEWVSPSETEMYMQQ